MASSGNIVKAGGSGRFWFNEAMIFDETEDKSANE